jgi:hypothetical protein
MNETFFMQYLPYSFWRHTFDCIQIADQSFLFNPILLTLHFLLHQTLASMPLLMETVQAQKMLPKFVQRCIRACGLHVLAEIFFERGSAHSTQCEQKQPKML